jgi:hypothetical protein
VRGFIPISACAIAGPTGSSEARDNTLKSFTSVTAELPCSFPCSGTFGFRHAKLQEVLIGEQYEQLAVEVMSIGFSCDLAWYYLGRAAEGLHQGSGTGSARTQNRSLLHERRSNIFFYVLLRVLRSYNGYYDRTTLSGPVSLSPDCHLRPSQGYVLPSPIRSQLLQRLRTVLHSLSQSVRNSREELKMQGNLPPYNLRN